MKYLAQVKNLSAGELVQKAKDLQKQIIKFRLEKHTGRTRNVRQMFIWRKQRAMVQTLLTAMSK